MDLAFLPILVFLLLALLMLVLLILSLPALVRLMILELLFIGKPVCMDHYQHWYCYAGFAYIVICNIADKGIAIRW